MSPETVLVTGATGQDGWYLLRYLSAQGYDVHAQSRSKTRPDADQPDIKWHAGDLAQACFLEELVRAVRPSQLYNLAAVSRPHLSWELPRETAELNAIVPHRLCEEIRRFHPTTRLFQASSSDIFAASGSVVQDEQTPCDPRTPYGIAKAYAHRIIGAYRSQYGLHLSSGILFNHESPRRPLGYVSQKIAHAAANVAVGKLDSEALDENGQPILRDGRMRLGRIDISRDFGYAGDYVEAMHAIVQSDVPDDFVIGTGQTHSIAEFCELAFRLVGRDWRNHVTVDEALVRKVDTNSHANPAKLHKLLGHGFKTDFSDLVRLMVEAQIALLRNAASVDKGS